MSPSEPTSDGAESIPLLDGRTAVLIPREHGWSLEIDGVPQSHVEEPGRPPTLTSVRWMLMALGGGPALTCAHLGGGMLSLPRALAQARPGSQQVVVELEPTLVELLRERFGLPDGVVVEIADGRAWLATAEPGGYDAVTVDVFAGGRIPAAFTSIEHYRAVHAALRPGGMLVVNSVAGPEIGFTRGQLATLRAVFTHVGMIVQGSALHGARFGNATLIASDEPIPVERIRGELRGDVSKGALLIDLDEIVGDAVPVTDATAVASPEPRMRQVEEALAMVETLRTAVSQLRRAATGAPDDDEPPAASRG